jgi:non-ribosomal peptide synthetase-like protein
MPTPVRLDPGDLPVQRGDVTADLPCAETLVHQACPVSAPATPTRLHHFFERSCTANPRNLALVAGDDRLTYAALDARADQIAHHLLRRSVCAGDRVGLLLERSAPAYAALLAVLKCGAALVPLDPSFPAERIAYIAEDADLRLLVTAAKFGDAVAGARCPILALDADASVAASGPLAGSAEACKRAACGYGADDPLCYIIYTSGTTGRPKGVAVHQSNICNYLRACASVYGVTPHDRVYQGITFAFDFSIEEIWIAFAAGAALVAGPTDHRRIGAGLTEFLIEQDITVLGCVPTLLATLERDVPSLRTLIVGGEACSPDLVRRWAKPGRRMLNTYGPTETTITATWTAVTPDRPVTIGKPLPTYTAYLLNEALRPVPRGEAGEICIGGPGVAAGYVNRPDLTAEKFVPDPFATTPGARLYRTGDLGRLTPGGDIEFLGRIDTQVKIRGFRIELGEIEAVLLEDPAVANAVVALTATEGRDKELAAYVSLRGPILDREQLRLRLHDTMRRRLPFYMVPAYVEILAALPTLPSGKADRAGLPAPSSVRLGARSGEEVPPQTPLERTIAAAWGGVFGRHDLSVEADFFLDLGGHSLFAARVTSELRQDPALRHLAVGDLYAHPTIRGLARFIEDAAAARQPATDHKLPAPPPRHYGSARVWVCGATQAALLYLTFVIVGTPVAALLAWEPASPATLFLGGVLAFGAVQFLSLLLPVALKWLLIGRFRPGRYQLWGWYYCRWWLVRRVMALAPVNYLTGSPLLALYLRLLGARVGTGCHLGSAAIQLPDLIEVGDGASIGYGAVLEPFYVEGGWLVQKRLRIGAGAFVGANAVVMLGGKVGAGARLTEQSLVARDQAVPDGETWAGSPSRHVAAEPQLDAMAAQPPPAGWSLPLLAGFVFGFLLLELLPSLLVAPALAFLYEASGGEWLKALALTPVGGVIFVLTTCAVVALGKRLVLPRVRPGVFPQRSWFGLRKWFADKLMLTSLTATNSLYATLYTLPWLRLLGARVGPRAEVSTVSNIDPDLLILGSESFVADYAVVGASRYHHGLIALGTTELEGRSFVGNASLVPGDTRLAHGSLLGVLSVPPAGPVEPGTSWLGSPAIFLPRRQPSAKFDEEVTFRPPPRLVACRLAIEFVRVILPPTLMYALFFLYALAAVEVIQTLPGVALAIVLPGVYLIAAVLVVGVVAALKWLVVGRYRPRVRPLWSHFVWRTELITALYESVAVPWLLRWLTGTPFLPPFLRLLGARMGRRVYLETTFLTEFDLVRVGDDAAVSGLTSLQTHLFEDRVMKMSTVTVGTGCNVGPRAVILYDAELAAGAELDALSLAMKGEVLPAASRWRGIPARPVE